MKKKKMIAVTSILGLIVISIILVTLMKKPQVKAANTKTANEKERYDTISPVITLKGKKEIIIREGEIYKEEGYSAVDNVDGNIVRKVSRRKEVIDNQKYRLVYLVTDSAGNTAREERIVYIQNKNNCPNHAITPNNVQGKNKGIIYLTFDDGPSTSSTPEVLNILKKHQIKATFFILNYTKDTEYLVKREVAEGHTVAIHGYSHDYGKIYQSEKAYMDNLNKLQAKIYQSTGVKATITRFPGGSSNTISDFNPGIMTKLTKKVVKEGYTYFDWNVDSNDAGGAKNAKEVYKNVTEGLYKNGKNVVLMHDFSRNRKTIQALDKIIEYGKNHGYDFQPITKDTPMITHSVNN